MEMLELIQQQTERLIKELNWSQAEIDGLVTAANGAIERKAANSTENTLVVHPATYSGGFILFGGWTNIVDKKVPSGCRGHRLYLAFGGVGIGGWDGDCDIELLTDGVFTHEGQTYWRPLNHYHGNDWNGYSTSFDWFYDHVKSFMFMYLPVFAQPIPIFVYFDGDSNRIGISVPSCSLSIGVGGGSVSVESND